MNVFSTDQTIKSRPACSISHSMSIFAITLLANFSFKCVFLAASIWRLMALWSVQNWVYGPHRNFPGYPSRSKLESDGLTLKSDCVLHLRSFLLTYRTLTLFGNSPSTKHNFWGHPVLGSDHLKRLLIQESTHENF